MTMAIENQDNDLYETLKNIRRRMETGRSKCAVSVVDDDDSCSDARPPEHAFARIDDKSLYKSPREQNASSTVQLSVPPLFPHNDSWLRDDVPTTLPKGFDFANASIKKKRPQQQVVDCSTPVPDCKELRRAFASLAERNTVDEGNLSIPYMPSLITLPNSDIRTSFSTESLTSGFEPNEQSKDTTEDSDSDSSLLSAQDLCSMLVQSRPQSQLPSLIPTNNEKIDPMITTTQITSSFEGTQTY